MGFLQGKTVIITGGGRATLADGSCGSIGYGIATAYAKEGANIVITGRNVAKLDDAKKELEEKYGVKVLPIQADVSSGKEIVASNYLEKEKDYNNNLSKLGIGISNLIEKGFDTIMNFIFNEVEKAIKD